MGSIIKPSEPPYTDIILQTRIKNDIPNSQSHEFHAFDKRLFLKLEEEFKTALFREPPNPIYNCHGLIFASRRTGITDNTALQLILCDDGYQEVAKEDVLPGDIILYYYDDGDVEHSGVVISKPDSQLKIPLILSKWGRQKNLK